MNNPQGLDVCPIPALGYAVCDTTVVKTTGQVLVGQTFDFSAAVTQPFWALGFSSLGNAYPAKTNIQQAFFYDSLQVYPSDLSQLSATKVQFSDAYETPSGLVQTKWTVTFDHANQKITVSDLMTFLPQSGGFRACTEILLGFYKLNIFNFAVAPGTILLPYE